MIHLAEVPTFQIVVAAALIAPDAKILMQKRRTGAAHGGLWEFPGGKVERKESPISALVRELREELGISVSPNSITPAGFAFEDLVLDRPRLPIAIFLYTCREWIGEVQCLDAETIGWFESQDIAALPMPPLDVPLAAQLDRLLSAGVI